MKNFPSYIVSNASCYEVMAEEYYTSTARAHTKEEFEREVDLFCRYWRSNLTDENVQEYLRDSGLMEPSDLEVIQNYYVSNAGPLQKKILSANLVEGERYTLVYLDEFGFPAMEHITFQRASICSYAQHNDAVKIVYKRARARSLTEKYLYKRSFAIYKGWCDKKESDTFEKMSENEQVTTMKSKYSGFDSRFFTDMVERLGDPFVEYRNFVTRADGKVFA